MKKPQDVGRSGASGLFGDDDPDYQAFVIQASTHCRCVRGPCAGVLAGGLCDGFNEEWEERQRQDGYDGNEDGRWDDYPYV